MISNGCSSGQPLYEALELPEEHLGLGYLASLLRQEGFRVEILDATFRRFTDDYQIIDPGIRILHGALRLFSRLSRLVKRRGKEAQK